MAFNDFWDTFERSGSVMAYLDYVHRARMREERLEDDDSLGDNFDEDRYSYDRYTNEKDMDYGYDEEENDPWSL